MTADRESREPYDESYLLTAPAESLCPGHLAEAIRTARAAGRVSTDALGSPLVAAVRAGPVPLPAANGYYDCVVSRLAATGAVDGRVDAHWAAAFQRGVAQRDPRVQAFASACVERLAELVATVQAATAVLARYLEAPAPTIAVHGLVEGGRPVLGCGRRRFVVIERCRHHPACIGSALAAAERYAAAESGAPSGARCQLATFGSSFIVEWCRSPDV